MLYLNVHQTSDAGKVEGDFSNSYTYVDLMVKKIPLKKTKKKNKKEKFTVVCINRMQIIAVTFLV